MWNHGAPAAEERAGAVEQAQHHQASQVANIQVNIQGESTFTYPSHSFLSFSPTVHRKIKGQ